MQTNMLETITGEEIFFPFIELPFSELKNNPQLIRKIKDHELDGFVTRGVLNAGEVAEVISELKNLERQQFLVNPSGATFPAPFAIIRGNDSTLDNYFYYLNMFKEFGKKPAIKKMIDRLEEFFILAGKPFDVSTPKNTIKNEPVAPGNFREFLRGQGGIHIHCGNFFQEQFQGFFSQMPQDMVLEDQLSFFMVLQNSEVGGELTIYDILWKDVKRKESLENNEYVIDDNNQKRYVKDLRSFTVRPQPGDILVFAGGPIWHRVENIAGTTPRITFGGFINFNQANDKLYYWS